MQAYEGAPVVYQFRCKAFVFSEEGLVSIPTPPPPPEFAVGDQHHTSRVCPFHLVLRYAAILAGVPRNTAEGDRGIKRVWK